MLNYRSVDGIILVLWTLNDNFQGYSNDISEERNQKQNNSILDLDVDGTKGMIIKMIH